MRIPLPPCVIGLGIPASHLLAERSAGSGSAAPRRAALLGGEAEPPRASSPSPPARLLRAQPPPPPRPRFLFRDKQALTSRAGQDGRCLPRRPGNRRGLEPSHPGDVPASREHLAGPDPSARFLGSVKRGSFPGKSRFRICALNRLLTPAGGHVSSDRLSGMHATSHTCQAPCTTPTRRARFSVCTRAPRRQLRMRVRAAEGAGNTPSQGNPVG